MSERVYYKQVGIYHLSVILRECSALESYGHMYRESAIFTAVDAKFEFVLHPIDVDLSRNFDKMNTEEDVLEFVKSTKDDELI